MPLPNDILEWIDLESPSAIAFTTQLSAINSWSYNAEGIRACLDFIESSLPFKNISIERVSHQSNGILIVKKQTSKGKNLLFNIHCDTVYPPTTDFPISETKDTLYGPGVADAKGGLAVLIWSLMALDKLNLPPFNWTLIINSDEEIGSPFSKETLVNESKKHDFGFIFEPALPNGNIVSSRKGSYNGKLISKGKSAHAGRNIHDGINAITPLCDLLSSLNSEFSTLSDLSYNLGLISGGTALNQVPDYAEATFNLRSFNPQTIDSASEFITKKIKTSSQNITLSPLSYRPPKQLNNRLQFCIDTFSKAANELNLSVRFESSGGVCDGNDLNDSGLPVIDTLGPVGGGLHSLDEYVLKESFSERIKLATLYISKIIQHS